MSTMPYPSPQQVFQMQYDSVRRDEVVGVLLALFLGCFGVHHFYVGRVGLGITYCLFSWTGIPSILGVIECFFMPGRVRAYNAAQAMGLAAALGLAIPGFMGYPAWVAPAYPQPVYVSVQNVPPNGGPGAASSSMAEETTLLACRSCGQTHPAGSRFCARCGTQLG
jgi:TM2 domain-containing membrane protein YozV